MSLKMKQFDNNKLLPAIVQDEITGQVLMLGYMNQEAYNLTEQTKKVTFYSRSRQCLWIKGETSGNYLDLISLSFDCDQDSILVKVKACGPTCHTGKVSCFEDQHLKKTNFLNELQLIISQRFNKASSDSYTGQLFKSGVSRCAQKVAEEAIEVALAAKDNDQQIFISECADLIYHLLVLLKIKETTLEQVVGVLESRNKR